MKCVVQRVDYSKVEVDNRIVGKIDKGLNVLVGFTDTDTIDDLKYCVKKITNLRIFEDSNDVMNLSVLDVGGEILCISQFTLYGDATKGNRPSYIKALSGDKASPLYDQFCEMLNEIVHTEKGIFGAEMKVTILNDGPVTIIIDTDK